MKKRMAVLLLLAMGLILPATGEVRLTRRIHVNSFYHEGIQRPERTTTVDIWVAPARMACLAGPAKIIIDADRDLLILVNDSTKTYAQAVLSKPVSASMTPDDREAMPSHDTRAAVRKTDQTRTVLGRICRGYTIDLRSNLDHKVTAWVSADVPLDLAAYGILLKKLYVFLGRYDGASTEALLSVPGYILSEEDVADLKGETLRVSKDVIEMSEKTPLPGLFTVPAGTPRGRG